MGRAGRPRKTGERYASGRLVTKRPGEAIPPALLGRIKNLIIKTAKMPQLEGRVGELVWDGQLSNTQAAAALKVRDVYRTYHRLRGLRETAKSQSFERGFGSADLAEERMTPEELDNFEAAVRKATEAWEKLDLFLAGIDRQIRQAIMDLCIYETTINSLLLPAVRAVLDALAQRWAEGWRQTPDKPRELRIVQLSARVSVETTPRQRRDTVTQPLEAVVRKIRPDLDDEGVTLVIETFHALRARVEYRRTKETRR